MLYLQKKNLNVNTLRLKIIGKLKTLSIIQAHIEVLDIANVI